MLKGWKTIIISLVTAAFGVLEATDVTSVIDSPDTAGVVVSVIGVINLVLRAITTTPIGQK